MTGFFVITTLVLAGFIYVERKKRKKAKEVESAATVSVVAPASSRAGEEFATGIVSGAHNPTGKASYRGQ